MTLFYELYQICGTLKYSRNYFRLWLVAWCGHIRHLRILLSHALTSWFMISPKLGLSCLNFWANENSDLIPYNMIKFKVFSRSSLFCTQSKSVDTFYNYTLVGASLKSPPPNIPLQPCHVQRFIYPKLPMTYYFAGRRWSSPPTAPY
jgi:hypothetical protein